jgi:hypothetical protein
MLGWLATLSELCISCRYINAIHRHCGASRAVTAADLGGRLLVAGADAVDFTNAADVAAENAERR